MNEPKSCEKKGPQRSKVMTDLEGYLDRLYVGQSAGQTVFHVQVHLIPKRDGDVAEPKGGVRGVIPSKQRY